MGWWDDTLALHASRLRSAATELRIRAGYLAADDVRGHRKLMTEASILDQRATDKEQQLQQRTRP